MPPYNCNEVAEFLGETPFCNNIPYGGHEYARWYWEKDPKVAFDPGDYVVRHGDEVWRYGRDVFEFAYRLCEERERD